MEGYAVLEFVSLREKADLPRAKLSGKAIVNRDWFFVRGVAPRH